MSFVTVPSFPTVPDGLLSPCDEAEVLRELCISGPMSVAEAAAVLKIPKPRALHLHAILQASSDLQTFFRRHCIALEPAGLLARIETLDRGVAQHSAVAYVRRDLTTRGMRVLLDGLLERGSRQAATNAVPGRRR